MFDIIICGKNTVDASGEVKGTYSSISKLLMGSDELKHSGKPNVMIIGNKADVDEKLNTMNIDVVIWVNDVIARTAADKTDTVTITREDIVRYCSDYENTNFIMMLPDSRKGSQHVLKLHLAGFYNVLFFNSLAQSAAMFLELVRHGRDKDEAFDYYEIEGVPLIKDEVKEDTEDESVDDTDDKDIIKGISAEELAALEYDEDDDKAYNVSPEKTGGEDEKADNTEETSDAYENKAIPDAMDTDMTEEPEDMTFDDEDTADMPLDDEPLPVFDKNDTDDVFDPVADAIFSMNRGMENCVVQTMPDEYGQAYGQAVEEKTEKPVEKAKKQDKNRHDDGRQSKTENIRQEKHAEKTNNMPAEKTDKKADRETDRKSDRETVKKADRKVEKTTDRETDRETVKKADKKDNMRNKMPDAMQGEPAGNEKLMATPISKTSELIRGCLVELHKRTDERGSRLVIDIPYEVPETVTGQDICLIMNLKVIKEH